MFNGAVNPQTPAGRETAVDAGGPLAPGATTGQRLLAIYEIGRQLLEQKEPPQVIRAIHRAIVENLQPDHACVLAIAPDGSYRPLAVHGMALDGPQERWELSRTVLRRAQEGELAVLASDVRRDAEFEGAGSVHRLRIRSVMCVPLGSRPVRGLIYLDNRADERPFSCEDLEFLRAASLYASLVLARTEEWMSASEALRDREERLGLLQEELLRHEIVGCAPALLAAYDAVRRLARSGARVLLRGETGTGKELFARAYAANSDRRGGPYVPVPIPALAPGLLESELFGHVRGAFTEATRDKKGRLELAQGGTLFLDEVGDVEPALQTKLLRFLDSGELHRVGDNEPRFIDTRVVSATNRPLERDLEEGRFRADLLARLGHAVKIPPLRERPEDIPVLVEHFLRRYHRGAAPKVFSPAALERLQRHAWPFNVRELQQVVERTVCLVDHDVVEPADLPEYLRSEPPVAGAVAPADGGPPRPLHQVMDELEKSHILRALDYAGGNKRLAIDVLKISPDTFYRRLREFGIQRKDR
jgi:DNA-binding NtrC family response regulator